MDHKHEINSHLTQWMRWYRLRRAAAWAVHGLAFGLGIGLFISLLLIQRSLLLRQEVLAVVLSIAAGSFLLGASIGFAWPISRLRAARYFDLRFGLRERISTALEVLEKGYLDREPDGLHAKQLADALAAARKVKVRTRLPIRIAWQEALLVLLFGVSVFLLYRWGQPYFQAAQEQRAMQNAIEAETAEVEALLEEIEGNSRLRPEQKDALREPLEEARRQLQGARTLEGSVSTLNRAEGELRSLTNPETQAQGQALREAGQNLSQAEESPLQSFGQQLAAGETQAAAQALNELDLSQMEQPEREALADQLEEAAGSLAQTDPELAEQLQDAAESLQAGDTQAGQQELQDAARRLSESGERVEGSAQAGRAAAELEAARQRLMQQAGGQSPAADAGEEAAGTSGSGAAGETGTSAGQPPASGGASGAGRGEGSGETGAGGPAGADPIGQGNAPGDGGERPYEPISPPQWLGGSGGEAVTLPGGDQSGDTITGEGDLPFDQPGQSQVPYVDVYPQYAEIYRQAIESGQVPLGLRSVVRDYFSSLEP